MDNFKLKYLKYKKKYTKLKKKKRKAPLKLSQRIRLRRPSLIVDEDNKLENCVLKKKNICIVTQENSNSYEFDIKELKSLGATGYILGLIDKDESPTNITDKKIYLNKRDNIINSGGFGTVYRLENQNDPTDYYVYKKFSRIKDYHKEKIISILIHKLQSLNDNKFNIIPSYWYDYEDTRIILMHGRNGDLFNLYKSGSSFNPFNLFLQTLTSVYDLYKIGIYYCDIKPENILYRRHSDTHKLNIILADIGGIYFDPNNNDSNILGPDIVDALLIFKKNKNNKFYELFINDDGSNSGTNLHFIGYVEIPDGKKFNNKVFQVIKSEDGKYKLMGTYDGIKEFHDIPLNIIFDGASFTYPHLKNYPISNFLASSDIDRLDKNNIVRDNLINNIFQSLGVLLISLINKGKSSYYYKYYWNNYKSCNDYGPNKQKIIDYLNKKFSEKIAKEIGYLLFENLITLEFVLYKKDSKVKEMFEKLIRLSTKLNNQWINGKFS
jgi:serine/threonine protein kinase